MDRFEKLELILQAMMAEKRMEIERAKNASHSAVYIQGLEDQLTGFQKVSATMLDIKNDGYSVSDAMIEKLWQPKIKS
ncbi:MAG TPA: hypothetical protein VJZ68_03840 [Nitrososphaera sp.]|nr:hypothetical protein [Nitrososphaera sp.]